ncbi:MAG: heavy-metal-associated domain-containing protein [Sphingobacteriaceae bacterium]|nr:heavy-metal-associated domain-containing protein [Sphingobacteriaceae bacterium]MBP7810275.1 heavy-metal-associated domain-containing protein [Bacteroidia bacterium]
METQIIVDNLKCGGCAATIKKELKKLTGIIDVKVIPEQSEVDVSYNDSANLNLVKERLNELGYPVNGTDQGGLEKITTNLKSYVSCAIGRLSKDEETDKSQDLK